MRIYVAGASAELTRCGHFIERAREAGHVITYDWPAEVRRRASLGYRDADLAPEERSTYAERDLEAIDDAEVVVLLVPALGVQTAGLWTELGHANAATSCRVIAVSSEEQRRAYLFLALQRIDHVATEDEALALLRYDDPSFADALREFATVFEEAARTLELMRVRAVEQNTTLDLRQVLYTEHEAMRAAKLRLQRAADEAEARAVKE